MIILSLPFTLLQPHLFHLLHLLSLLKTTIMICLYLEHKPTYVIFTNK